MKLRKLIALLSAALVLLALIPTGGLLISAATTIFEHNFENNNLSGWENTAVSADAAHTGNYGVSKTTTGKYGSLGKYSVTLEANTLYKVSFWYKSNANSIKNAAFEVQDSDKTKLLLTNKASQYVTLAISTDWAQMDLYFLTGSNASISLLFYRASSSDGDSASLDIDDVVLTKEGGAPSNDGYISDGDFESGSMAFTSNSIGTITTNAHTGSYAVTGSSSTKYAIYAQKLVTLEKNTDYTFKFWAKASGSGKVLRAYINAKSFSSSSEKDLRGTYSNHTVNTDWAEYEITFNSGDNTSVVLSLCSSGSSSTFYLDDLTLIGPNSAEPEEPETVNNLMVNGDFETGSFTGWSSYSGTTISSTVVHGGKYSMATTNTTSKYQTINKQTVTLKANTDYLLTFWYYYEGTNAEPSFYTYINVDSSTSIDSNTTIVTSSGVWSQVTFTFNSKENTSLIVYVKNRTANDGGTYYFDDFVLIDPNASEPEEPDIPVVNLLQNGTFEGNSNTGWTLYNGTAVSTAAKYAGDYGLHCKGLNWNSIASTIATVEVGKSYELSFWYKINTDGFNWAIKGDVTGTKYAGTWQNTNLGVWQQLKAEFVADDTSVKLSISGLNASSTPDFYVDNVVIREIPSPSNDGFIINGDFEIGTTVGWNLHQSTGLSAAAAHNSNYGINLKGDGGWGGMLNQAFTTKKGLKYTLTLDVKVNSYGVNMQVRNVADDATLASQWITKTEWTTYTYTFTAISTDTYLNFCGGGKGAEQNLTEDVYVDNIKIVEIPCAHEYDGLQDGDCNVCGETRDVPLVDIVAGGMTSISEDVNGLAFRFEMAATGTRKDNNNKYVSGSANIRPFGNDDYTLIAMGAIITNKADIGTEALLNLNSVNGKTVVKSECVYLAEVSETSLVFTARIVNIPDAGKNTPVYARPYYVFEKDGETMVVYDTIVSKTYADAGK